MQAYIYQNNKQSSKSKHSKTYLEAVGEGSALEAALELEDHTGVKLNCNDRFSGFQKLLRQVSGTRTDLEDNICALDSGFLDDCVNQQGVFKDVLTL